ncbi:hypothetical protein GUJ93_ZPchr0013g36338 [Zizania palustris]|uniref:Uncharacterized protein n=1 Tax=Zizania palustris TaxID=103762 RepID=A0A8J5X540_ZIZPA|nr:hypothetical protein GUJ93_ZPchr0013g36338 [Zizania palustris]
MLAHSSDSSLIKSKQNMETTDAAAVLEDKIVEEGYSLHRWAQDRFPQTKKRVISSSPWMVAWKKTASPWLQAAHRMLLVQGRVGSEVTSYSTCVCSPAECCTSFRYTHLLSSCLAPVVLKEMSVAQNLSRTVANRPDTFKMTVMRTLLMRMTALRMRRN